MLKTAINALITLCIVLKTSTYGIYVHFLISPHSGPIGVTVAQAETETRKEAVVKKSKSLSKKPQERLSLVLELHHSFMP